MFNRDWGTCAFAMACIALHPGLLAAASATRRVTVGAFALDLPPRWKPLPSAELKALRQQFESQAKEIYRQYGGAPDPTRVLDFAALNVEAGSVFVGLVLSLPPEADQMANLIAGSSHPLLASR